ncbi:hypothetical protein Avbf_05101 [Armadillidium vulgare]|nr:hypothetical protein Avbf_05101 [Armadillidium vulgare]
MNFKDFFKNWLSKFVLAAPVRIYPPMCSASVKVTLSNESVRVIILGTYTLDLRWHCMSHDLVIKKSIQICLLSEDVMVCDAEAKLSVRTCSTLDSLVVCPAASALSTVGASSQRNILN